MDCKYIIVQAGGRGSRMEQLTANKPKALVPIGNRPMLFHLFDKFPDKYFIIISDYKSDVMRKYLATFANVKYLIVETHGKKGTCSGIEQATKLIPNDTSFMLIWSDLVLPEDFKCPVVDNDYVGLSKNFTCRWRYLNGRFDEIRSDEFGVAGLFIFQNKDFIQNVPEEGEFVKWLQSQNHKFNTLNLYKTKEYGLISEWTKDNSPTDNIENRCRPFNQLVVTKDYIEKRGINEQGRQLAKREKEWYKSVEKYGFKLIPQIYSYEPFRMQKIDGKNVFEYDLRDDEKKRILDKIVEALRTLHSYDSRATDYFSIYDAYIKKTFDRLNKIRDLIPHADERFIVVNGKKCRNIFFNQDLLIKKISNLRCEQFVLIHGDNTFSNILLDKNKRPILIDPRGYFGYTELYGDPLYDWAKLYYSLRGNYDKFNLKRFKLIINETDVQLNIESNNWEHLCDYYCNIINGEVNQEQLDLVHAIIWLSLTTYAWEDYDSICGAFYNGLYYLEEVL